VQLFLLKRKSPQKNNFYNVLSFIDLTLYNVQLIICVLFRNIFKLKIFFSFHLRINIILAKYHILLSSEYKMIVSDVSLCLFAAISNIYIARAFILRNQCFPTFFCSRHPFLAIKIFGGIPSWLNRYKDQEIITIGGTVVCRGTQVGNYCSKCYKVVETQFELMK